MCLHLSGIALLRTFTQREEKTMDISKINLLQSDILVSELYRFISSEEFSNVEYRIGVLLRFSVSCK